MKFQNLKKHEKIKNLYAEHDKIDARNEELQQSVEKQLKGRNTIEQIFTIRWQLV